MVLTGSAAIRALQIYKTFGSNARKTLIYQRDSFKNLFGRSAESLVEPLKVRVWSTRQRGAGLVARLKEDAVARCHKRSVWLLAYPDARVLIALD